MRRKTAAICLLCLFVAGTLFLPGWGGGVAPEDTKQKSEAAGEEQKTGENEIVLTIVSNANWLTSLDKFNNVGYAGDDTGYLWGDPLIANDHHGNYSAALAKEWWMDEDGLAYTFRLRKDIMFQNGEMMTSHDVKVTYERLLDPTLGYTNSWSALSRVETPDDYTAVIHLASPMPTFYDEVGFVPIICASEYEKDPQNFFRKPVGTGAYSVESFDAEKGEAHFVRNKNWWSTNDGNTDEIIYRFVAEDTELTAALESGKADAATMLTQDFREILGDKFVLTDIVTDSHIHLGFNSAKGRVFENYELRAALSMSIDRQMLCNSILGGGAVSTWPIPAGNFGYVDGYKYEYDMERAKQLVESSGYDGEEINMIYSTAAMHRADEIAQAVRSRGEEAGLNIILEPLEDAEFQRRRHDGEYDVTLAEFASTCGDPQTEAAYIIADDIFHTGYQNQELREKCRAIRAISDKEERRKRLEEIFAIEMADLAPFVYLYSPMKVFVSAPEVSNITVYNDSSADYRFAVKANKNE